MSTIDEPLTHDTLVIKAGKQLETRLDALAEPATLDEITAIRELANVYVLLRNAAWDIFDPSEQVPMTPK